MPVYEIEKHLARRMMDIRIAGARPWFRLPRSECYECRRHMSNPSIAWFRLRSAAVAIVLVLGLVNMMRGGSPHTSQKLMRLRVLLQFVALVDHHACDLDDGAVTSWSFLNRIYTRTGDDGTTSLGTGERRKKYDLRVDAYGTLDEVNAAIGIVRLHTGDDPLLDAHARAHPERYVRCRGRSLHPRWQQGQGAGRRQAHCHRQAGGVARTADRRAQ